MDKKITDYITEANKKLWVSITGYRTLLLFISILEKPRTIEELVEIAQSNEITKKSTSKDTLRFTLSTLKAAGCKFERPSKANDYKYSIISHPFGLILTPEDVDALILLRERIAPELSWKKVILLNELYSKLFSLSHNQEYIDKVENTKPLGEIDLKILSDISNPDVIGKKVNIEYNSPKFEKENLDIIPQKITYENSKLYLWCYNYKYKHVSVINIERIKKINSISIKNADINTTSFVVEYEVFASSVQEFKSESYEEIIEAAPDKILVKANVSNEFLFIQRLLLFGSEFKIISPESFREKLINKIIQIRKGYLE